MVGNYAERASRFSFANCCLVPSQMNLVFWALRRSRFEDIQSARAPPLPGAWYKRPPLPRWGAMQICLGVISIGPTAGLIAHRKIRDYQYQKCRVDIVIHITI